MSEETKCKYCGSTRLHRSGYYESKTKKGFRLECQNCKRSFLVVTETREAHYKKYGWTKEQLEDLFWNKGLTIPEIAKKFGASRGVTYVTFKTMGIRLRHVVHPWTKESLFQMYWVDNMSTPQIAERFQTTPSVVYLSLKRFGIPMKSLSYAGKQHHPQLSGKDHPCWKGGRYDKGDYIWVTVDKDDFFYPMAIKGRVAEHRLVVAKDLGRNLHTWETVHHINGDKKDNRRENLQLVTDERHDQITRLETKIKVLQRKITKLQIENQKLKEQGIMRLVKEAVGVE